MTAKKTFFFWIKNCELKMQLMILIFFREVNYLWTLLLLNNAIIIKMMYIIFNNRLLTCICFKEKKKIRRKHIYPKQLDPNEIVL